jgi:hypothetical protein
MIRHIAVLVALAAAPVVGGLASAPPAAAAGFGGTHCKNAAHLEVDSPAPGTMTILNAADVDIVVEQVTDTSGNGCVNDPMYRGPLYVFDIDGNLGLRMEPSGATAVQAQFRADSPNSVELEHTVKGSETEYAEFSNGARAHIVGELHDLGF